MKRPILLAIAMTASFLVALPAIAADTNAAAFDAAAAFKTIRTLEGDWYDPERPDLDVAVRYDVTAAGSTVVLTYSPGQPAEMVTVYHMDGDDLLLTHYCALKNAPKMRFEATDKPGEIHFGFAGGTNFDPAVDAHAHEGYTRIVDENTLETTAIGWSDGKPGDPRTRVLKRR